ncbi:MAG: hypothetical protein AAGA67_14395, partial [Cyanobacteria bacterium P01_F01_bin.153]
NLRSLFRLTSINLEDRIAEFQRQWAYRNFFFIFILCLSLIKIDVSTVSIIQNRYFKINVYLSCRSRAFSQRWDKLSHLTGMGRGIHKLSRHKLGQKEIKALWKLFSIPSPDAICVKD